MANKKWDWPKNCLFEKHPQLSSYQYATLSWKLQQQEKKVQAMRLHPSSNFPISGLKLIEKQIF